MTCCHPEARDEQFDARVAQHDLRRFRRRGPDAPTRQLLAAVAEGSLPDRPTLLDIGGGVGAIHHVLLQGRFASAQHVDASNAYLAAAAAEAERLGHRSRVEFVYGDFAAVADRVPAADVVTLDRVVCCDPDFVRLLTAAATHARRAVAFSYPRARWLARAMVACSNAVRRALGRAYRAYVHPPAAMAAVLERNGLRRQWAGGTWIWAVELFERAA
jgi:magnesium-protoporphyrin O-methyltransferase